MESPEKKNAPEGAIYYDLDNADFTKVTPFKATRTPNAAPTAAPINVRIAAKSIVAANAV